MPPSVETYEQAIQNVLNSGRQTTMDRDLNMSDITSIKSHNKSYTDLLESYTEFISKTLNAKRKMKNCFYWLSFLVMAAFSIIIIAGIILLFRNAEVLKSDYRDYILPALTALSSFITVLIVIPKIIAEYLFNSSEENIMNEVVKNIQEYDKTVREKLN